MRLRVLVAALVLALVPALGLMSPADAIGSTRGCRPGNFLTQTNDWGFFWNHKIRVYERACRKSAWGYYRYFRYVRTPTISFVSRGGSPPSGFGSPEVRTSRGSSTSTEGGRRSGTHSTCGHARSGPFATTGSSPSTSPRGAPPFASKKATTRGPAMPRNTGEFARGQVHAFVVVTGKALMWASISVATLDMCFLLVDVLRS